MGVKPKVRIFIESLIYPLIPWGINLFFPDNPGFSGLYFLPYLGLLLILSAYYGKISGFISLAVSIGLIAGKFRTSIPQFGMKELAVIPAACAGIYLLGTIRDMYTQQMARIRQRFKELVKENQLLKKTTSALSEVDRELEERVSRQEESITILSNKIQQIDSMDFQQALELLMDTVQIFIKAEKMSIWEHEHKPLRLILRADRGWEKNTNSEKKELSIGGSIHGWVFRNDKPFSVRMFLNYDHLRCLDKGENILTYPIVFNKSVWGVLNIEKMPFIKYNAYSEHIVHMILKLAEPALERAFEYENMIKTGRIDSETRLPVFPMFETRLNTMVEETKAVEGNLSIILVEIVNYEELVNLYGEPVILTLFPEISANLESVTQNRGQIFHYKNRNQMVIIMTNTDQDGASLLCLEVLEKINDYPWEAEGKKISLEAVIGFASFGEQITTPLGLMDRMEELVAVQKKP